MRNINKESSFDNKSRQSCNMKSFKEEFRRSISCNFLLENHSRRLPARKVRFTTFYSKLVHFLYIFKCQAISHLNPYILV